MIVSEGLACVLKNINNNFDGYIELQGYFSPFNNISTTNIYV